VQKQNCREIRDFSSKLTVGAEAGMIHRGVIVGLGAGTCVNLNVSINFNTLATWKNL